jgi:hypothetical protein
MAREIEWAVLPPTCAANSVAMRTRRLRAKPGGAAGVFIERVV